ncbi:hypothetical protein AB0442_38265 [Kitasatospora sp. NPDC085895]|uniref:hypothetical protein n=1 Tax=Kitasatospora sp. NPDC085895 TaxID=3155057 RepID=UPI00344CB7E1
MLWDVWFALEMGVHQRLLVLGVLCYLVVGGAYLSVVGISADWVGRGRPAIGADRGAVVAAGLVWVVLVLLWPVPLVRRLVRTARRRSAGAGGEVLQWSLTPQEQWEQALAEVPPAWFREAYVGVQQLLAVGRAVEALGRAAVLVGDSSGVFGDGHRFTGDARELLAHAGRAALCGPGERALLAVDENESVYLPAGVAL